MGNIYGTLWNILPTYRQTHFMLCEVLNDVYNRSLPPLWFNFDEENLRYSYCYLFFTANVYAVRDTMQYLYNNCNDIDILEFCMEVDNAKIFCFGGGAGYGIIGCFEWLKLINPLVSMTPHVADKHNWSVQLQAYLKKYNDDNISKNNHLFFQCDFVHTNFILGHQDPNMTIELSESDIFMFVYFFSQIEGEVNPDTKDQVKVLIGSASPMFYFFMDYATYYPLINELAAFSNLQLLARVDDLVVNIPEEEERMIRLNKYNNVWPKHSSRVCASLWKTGN